MIEIPSLRSELLEYLQELSDHRYQWDCWVNRKCPSRVKESCFDFAVHFLFDDTSLGHDCDAAIGIFLLDSSEAVAVAQVCEAINRLFAEYGHELSDAEYISKPEWKAVLNTAKDAHAILLSRDYGVEH